jgi:hypothetical protein
MKPLIIILSSILTLLITSDVNAHTRLNVADAFNEMKSLVGVWQKEGVEKPNLIVSFELIANSSVLVETWLNKGKKHSFTLYHLDNDNLMATHYCPQGNQPRLKLTNSSTINNLKFNFLDVTNLVNSTDSHQHSLGFEFSKDLNIILRKETYLSGSGEDNSELRLVRRK